MTSYKEHEYKTEKKKSSIKVTIFSKFKCKAFIYYKVNYCKKKKKPTNNEHTLKSRIIRIIY